IGGGFFCKAPSLSRGSTPAERKPWREGIYAQVRKVIPMEGNLSIERMCQLAQVGGDPPEWAPSPYCSLHIALEGNLGIVLGLRSVGLPAERRNHGKADVTVVFDRLDRRS